MNKLVLGTVQFGMNYGINNPKGKVPPKEVFDILEIANKNGINTVDTAYDYGESEKIIGKFIKQKKINFKVISKLPPIPPKEIIKVIRASLNRLNIDSFYGYLIHSFQSFLTVPEVYDLLNNFKKKGIIKKIGFSLYYPYELEYLLKNGINFDLIQVPYNVFDQRFAPYFPQLKNRGIKIYIRSVFLQGLVFKQPNKLTKRFAKIQPKIKFLNNLSEKLNIPLSAICLNFVILNPYIDKVVIGIDNKNNLEENIRDLVFVSLVKRVYKEISKLEEKDEHIILPINWNKKHG